MKIKTFRSLTKKEKEDFYAKLKSLSDSKDPAAENMWADDWHEQKHTLPYKLEKTELFDARGEFYIIYDNDKFVCCGGVYRSTFSGAIALAGTRTWVDQDYRNKLVVREILLPSHKKWAIDNGCKQIALCFNDYNKKLIRAWSRIRMGEDSRSPRLPHHLFYNNLTTVDFPVEIQYTKQWVTYEKLDPDWDFNWNNIKYIDKH